MPRSEFMDFIIGKSKEPLIAWDKKKIDRVRVLNSPVGDHKLALKLVIDSNLIYLFY